MRVIVEKLLHTKGARRSHETIAYRHSGALPTKYHCTQMPMSTFTSIQKGTSLRHEPVENHSLLWMFLDARLVQIEFVCSFLSWTPACHRTTSFDVLIQAEIAHHPTICAVGKSGCCHFVEVLQDDSGVKGIPIRHTLVNVHARQPLASPR